MEEMILILLAIITIGIIVYYIEKEEKIPHDEGIDNFYYQKPFHRTIKTHKNKLKNI